MMGKKKENKEGKKVNEERKNGREKAKNWHGLGSDELGGKTERVSQTDTRRKRL